MAYPDDVIIVLLIRLVLEIWAYWLKKLKELGYLDKTNYFLDNSDRDLFYRANIQKKWICGYVHFEFNSPLINGSTRKPRDEINEKYYQLKKQSTCNGMNGFLRHNAYKIKYRPIQQYAL